MIDYSARSNLAQNRKTQSIVGALKDTITSQLKSENPNEEVLKLVVNRQDEPKLLDQMGKIGSAISMIYKALLRPWPALFKIKGQVEVTKNAPVKITNLSELEKYFKELGSQIRIMAQAASMAPAPQIKIPDFPKIEIPKADNSKIEELLNELNDRISNIKQGEIKFPKTFDIGNFPPTMTPSPVTSISINPLRGVVKTTTTTVGTSLTKLPGYGQLTNRRAMLIYNNSANTIYIGGSDITIATGLPIPTNSYSPILDIGYDALVYGLASQGGNDVRVMEVSDDYFGGHPGL